MPESEWLQESKINAKNIVEWWKNKDGLTAGGVKFTDSWADKNRKPGVEDWKEKAKAFVVANSDKIPMKEAWVDNPKGYPNVLKRTLPFFVLVPAVRDVAEESKGTKSSPFGKLLYAILDTVTQEKKEKISGILGQVTKQLNRAGGGERVPLITATELRLKAILNELFRDCDLEIEFETPTIETLLTAPKLFIDDGFRNAVENKGHGLQRAVIFAILRRYAEHMTSSPDGKRRNLILAVEEPELYMHPHAQRAIRGVFRNIADGGDQVIFSTHSSLLVDVAHFDEIIRMESKRIVHEEKNTNESLAWQLPMSKMIEDIETRHPRLKDKVTPESMRDLYSHAYNPRRNEGFFASKIILVEGLTEEYSLPVYADALPDHAFDPRGISVVECGGKGQMDRLYRIFNELHIPCYILFDYDDGTTDANNIAKSKELLELAGEPQDAPKRLFVADCVACFSKTWEADLRTEIPDADALTAEARKELGLGTGSGEPLVARYIARRLVKLKPPVIPPSLKRIIEKATAVTWHKSCLSLGASCATPNTQNDVLG